MQEAKNLFRTCGLLSADLPFGEAASWHEKVVDDTVKNRVPAEHIV